MVGAGELNMVEVVDDGEDSVTGVVGVAGIEATSDSFSTVTEWIWKTLVTVFGFGGIGFSWRCLPAWPFRSLSASNSASKI